MASHRYQVGGNLTPGPSQGTPIQRQSLRRVPTIPALAKAVTEGTPEAFLEGMDIEGVDVAVVMPTSGMFIIRFDDLDPKYALALCQAYNNYAYEFTRANPERFKSWGWLPPHDATLAAQEARRCVEELGSVGVAITGGAINGNLWTDKFYEPLWQEVSRLGVPIGFHGPVGTTMRDSERIFGRYLGHPGSEVVSAACINLFHPLSLVAELILGGVLERYPNLKPVIMEANAGWLPWWLWRLDEKWETYGPDVDYTLSLKPSEYFRRQCYAVVDSGETPVKYVIDYLGADNLLISTDFPHHDSPFPEAINSFLALEGISDDSKRKILWDNGAKLFGLEVPKEALTT